MAIEKISFVSIPVKDQDRAIDFYTNKLGFKLEADTPMGDDGSRWVEVSVPGSDTRLVLYGGPDTHDLIGRNSPAAFSTSDIQATADELKAAGVEFTVELKTEFWGTFFMFKDLDGNQFLVSGPTVTRPE